MLSIVHGQLIVAPYTRMSVANEHRAGLRGAAPEENDEFMQFSVYGKLCFLKAMISNF